MPYSGADDPGLPGNVKKLPDSRRRQWVHVVNSCLEDGKPEGQCFRMANGVVRKEVADFVLEDGQEAAEGDELELAEKSYQYVESHEYESRKLSQSDADYNAVGGNGERACSNCYFFVSPARCTVVSGEIAPNGVSNQWRATPVYEPVPVPVVIVKSTARKQRSGIMRWLDEMRGVQQPPATEFSVYKAKDGTLRWFTRYSNAWEDLDKELITEAAHKEYIEWATSNNLYPELWLWHTPGTRFGQADWLDFAGGFAFAGGTVDADAEHVIDALKGKEVGVRHGFLHSQKGKYIDKYRTFEISVLPANRASVWTTNFSVTGKEREMVTFSKTRRDWLVGIHGEDWVKEQEKAAGEQADNLRKLGTEYKSRDELEAEAAAGSASASSGATPQTPPVTGEMLTEGFKAVTGQITELGSQIAALTGAVSKINERVGVLETSDKARIEKAVADEHVARVGVAAAAAPRPTESAENVLKTGSKEGSEAQDGMNWLLSQMSKDFGPVFGNAAPTGGVGAPAAAAVQQVAVPAAPGE
jgi:hypothetical protein